MRCIFCFNDTAKIFWDRKNRPYFYDPVCGNRIFFRSSTALKAILRWVEIAGAIGQSEWIDMLKEVEASQVYRHGDIQKWVDEVERKDEEVVARKDALND